VAIAALAIAIVGVCSGFVGATLGILNYHRDRPNVVVQLSMIYEAGGASARLAAINSGYRPTTILGVGFALAVTRVGIWPFRRQVPVGSVSGSGLPSWPGRHLPAVLPAGETFHFRGVPFVYELNDLFSPPTPPTEQVYVWVLEPLGRYTFTHSVVAPWLIWEDLQRLIEEEARAG
jgi:hypothetical protein